MLPFYLSLSYFPFFLCEGLGGSDIHSAMTYVRALSSDIDRWNIKGWTWKRVLETYKEVEKYSFEKGIGKEE